MLLHGLASNRYYILRLDDAFRGNISFFSSRLKRALETQGWFCRTVFHKLVFLSAWGCFVPEQTTIQWIWHLWHFCPVWLISTGMYWYIIFKDFSWMCNLSVFLFQLLRFLFHLVAIINDWRKRLKSFFHHYSFLCVTAANMSSLHHLFSFSYLILSIMNLFFYFHFLSLRRRVWQLVITSLSRCTAPLSGIQHLSRRIRTSKHSKVSCGFIFLREEKFCENSSPRLFILLLPPLPSSSLFLGPRGLGLTLVFHFIVKHSLRSVAGINLLRCCSSELRCSCPQSCRPEKREKKNLWKWFSAS